MIDNTYTSLLFSNRPKRELIGFLANMCPILCLIKLQWHSYLPRFKVALGSFLPYLIYSAFYTVKLRQPKGVSIMGGSIEETKQKPTKVWILRR